MKLFLASSASSLHHFSKKVYLPWKVVWFISDAWEPYRGTEFWSLDWITQDKDFFKAQNCAVIEFSLKETDIASFLESIDILHISGGSVWYVSQLLHIWNHAQLIQEYVIHKWLMYSGTSAWAMIVAHSVDMYVRYSGDSYEPKWESFPGLWLADFLIIPHANQKESVSHWQSALSFLPENQDSILSLKDGQAVWVEWESFNLLL